MHTVAEADHILSTLVRHWGEESVPLPAAAGRVLARPLFADRDMPPFDRVSMDGIAIRYADYAAGMRDFQIVATQAAGQPPLTLAAAVSGVFPAIEVMTGAVLPLGCDTVLPYEHLSLRFPLAQVGAQPVRMGQHVHRRATDRRQHDLLVEAGRVLGAAEIGVAAAAGAATLEVKKLPRVLILSSGDELVDVHQVPLPHQIRRSNAYALQAALRSMGAEATLQHLPDDLSLAQSLLADCLLAADVLLLSGGVSAGKFDYLPQALQACGVRCHFHRVRQRPGKPFWLGSQPGGAVVFAFPGNPVSTFLCCCRYFLPWLRASLGMAPAPAEHALLGEETRFEPSLTYFLPVRLH
ncbi:MAG TPA: molybdopterin molybdotransferase MoeA, partial [Saprospiraceae bacterium]|nr:molybdopterin molybdotransferase MoeA [Saprospiraceae bacterium]